MSKQRLKHYLEYLLLRTFSGLIRVQPLPRALASHKSLGRFWFEWIKIRRSQTLNNLRRAFPDLPDEVIEKLGRATFCHVSRVAIEHLLLSKMVHHGMEAYVGEGNWEVLDRALEEKRGVILMTAHQGNWEFAGAAIAARGYPVWAVAASMKNKRVDRFIFQHRSSLNVSIIRLQESARLIPAGLKKGVIVNLVADQDAGRKGVFVPFFGHPASTHSGGAIYAIRYKAPLLYLMTYFRDGRHHFYFERYPAGGGLKFSQKTIYQMLEWYSSRLERDIRKFPEQYFWMHRRWKTAPA